MAKKKKRTRKESGRAGRRARRSKPKPDGLAATMRRGDAPATVVYVHGIGRQPQPAALKRAWDAALFGRDVGDRSRMAYWADVLHRTGETTGVLEAAGLGTEMPLEAATVKQPVEELAGENEQAQQWVRKTYEAMVAQAVLLQGESDVAAAWGAMGEGPFQPEILPPGRLRRWVTEWITRHFLEDVAAYFYEEEERDRIRRRLAELLVAGGGPYVLVTHSLGTVIAYDVLHGIGKEIAVPLWITLGSPLGMGEVQDHVTKPLKVPPAVQSWHNFADRLDPVAVDRELTDDFSPKTRITDHRIVNRHTLRFSGFNPHSALGYLEHPRVQRNVGGTVGPNFAAPAMRFVIARDLAAEMAGPPRRRPVLIQLDEAVEGGTLQEKGKELEQELQKLTGENPSANIDCLRRFVAADLTPGELARLHARHGELNIQRLWRNSEKQALLNVSAHRVQAYTARVGYRATGRGIAWAVLDTGIFSGADGKMHPHFQRHENIVARWNCTQPGSPTEENTADASGHGTHVAGIIAGIEKREGTSEEQRDPYAGMAPEARLHIYKVLDDNGRGRDSWIIKALDHVASLNEKSHDLVIHGVNLSLGGPFDVEVFGCGHSPLCQELRRLWRMGVVVCVAAGNEGRVLVEGAGGPQPLNLDLSIGDPANLEEAIAVGSVHKEFPHLYGVSYFSSRGPTADGRIKPDVVAPGERIVSANAVLDPDDPQSFYIPSSGTSMACPHVSGIIAAFLSVRQEFVGRPDEAKRLLLEHATDLGRNAYHQGAGMPNLVRMLAGT